MNIKKITAAVLASATLLSASAFAYTDFEDTESTRLLSALDIMSGYDENTFAPDEYLTRSQMVKIIVAPLVYSEGESAFGSGAEISDVDPGNWAYKYWTYAIRKKLSTVSATEACIPMKTLHTLSLQKCLWRRRVIPTLQKEEAVIRWDMQIQGAA